MFTHSDFFNDPEGRRLVAAILKRKKRNTAAGATRTPQVVQHNHVTRDITTPGRCPACDVNRMNKPG